MSLKISHAELTGDPGGRYDRQRLIAWWDQDLVARARILVIGAGALGNEILKNLALLGIGNVLVVDMDVIERSNLSRGILFREADEGAPKAEVAVRRIGEIAPDVSAHAHVANVSSGTGLGVFLWADVVVCAVDNREARIYVNGACARTGRVWIDGAIEGFSGIVRVFDPAHGACYECTMNETDRRLVAERRSCAMLARHAAEAGHVPNTAVGASLVGAFQVQELLKVLHRQPSLVGAGLYINGMWNDFSRVGYTLREDCPGHESLGPVTPLGRGIADLTLEELLARAESRLGDGAVLDFSRDVVSKLSCPGCGQAAPGRAVLGEIGEREARCPACGAHRIVEIASSCSREADLDLASTPAELGLPPLDIVVARQGLEDRIAWLFDGDAPAVLGPLSGSSDWGGVRESA